MVLLGLSFIYTHPDDLQASRTDIEQFHYRLGVRLRDRFHCVNVEANFKHKCMKGQKKTARGIDELNNKKAGQ